MYSLFEYKFSNIVSNSFDSATLIFPLYKVTTKFVLTLSISLTSNPYSTDVFVDDNLFNEILGTCLASVLILTVTLFVLSTSSFKYE